jgi:hypothetical protein
MGAPGSCSTTHSGGDKSHFGIDQDRLNFFQALFRCLAPDPDLRRPQAPGLTEDELDFVSYPALGKCLCIGIANNKIATFYILAKHVVDSVASSSAYADHLNDGRSFFW